MGTTPVIVEVKTTFGGSNPAENLTDDQLDRLRRAGRLLQPQALRIDLITVTLSARGADLRWLRGVA